MDKSWDYVLSTLTKNGKVEKAAIITDDGIVTSNSDVSFTQEEINSLRCCLSGCYSSLVKLKVCGILFTCFRQGDDYGTLLGKAGDEILVAHRRNGTLIVGVGHQETPGSCLYEVTTFAKRMETRRQRYSRRMSQYS